ncbi:MAG: sigma-70 family RNA polymerase sigma factor [Rhodothermales bacterium]
MTMHPRRRRDPEDERPRGSTTLGTGGGWQSEDFDRVTNEELAQLASADVLESEAYFELWRRSHALVSDMVHHRIYGQDARHTVTDFFCHKLPRVLHKYTPHTRPRKSFEAWLVTVLRNYLNDEWRRGATRRRRQVSLDAQPPGLAERVDAQPPDVDQRSEHEHLIYFLREIMNQLLGPEDRYIFRARYWEDRSLKEIAQELGLTEENVRVRHWRAKKRLQKVCKIYRESGIL